MLNEYLIPIHQEYILVPKVKKTKENEAITKRRRQTHHLT
jgi:hypothetical protein